MDEPAVARNAWVAVLAAGGAAVAGWAFTYWQAAFIDALTQRQWETFWRLLAWIPVYLSIMAALGAAQTVAQARWTVALRSRAARADADRLVTAGLSAAAQPNDAHDLVQRAVEDVRQRAQWTTELTCGLAAQAPGFVLYGFTLAMALPLVALAGIALPAPMVWFALATFGLSTWLLHRAGRGIETAEHEVAAREAELRAGVAAVREYARSIGQLAGSGWEAAAMHLRLARLQAPVIRSAWRAGRVQAVGTLFGPSDLLVLSPLYFAGDLTFGQLFQVGMAHRGMGTALTWFADVYPTFARWGAAGERLQRWRASFAGQNEASSIVRSTGTPALAWRNLELTAGGAGAWRVKLPDVRLTAPGRYLLRAPSGFGKSTLLTALAGAWPWGTGHIEVPDGAVFVPQRPYFPVATLAEALAYPDSARTLDRAAAAEGLVALGLQSLQDSLDEETDWNARLSAGEAARLALLRALLKRPRWVFLDEPTANLDSESARRYWSAVQAAAVPAIVIVAHQDIDLETEEIPLAVHAGSGLAST